MSEAIKAEIKKLEDRRFRAAAQLTIGFELPGRALSGEPISLRCSLLIGVKRSSVLWCGNGRT